MISPKKCLFVCYGGGHSKMVLPVSIELKKRGWDCIVLALTMAGGEFALEKQESCGFSDFPEQLPCNTLEYGRVLAEQVSPGKVKIQETIAYLGASYSELVEDVGCEKAAELYAAKGRRAFLPRRTMARIIQKIRPDVVVATSSPRAEKATILAAGDLGVKCLCMLDLFGVDSDDDVINEIVKSGYGNKITVLGESVYRWLVARGRPSDEIEVTGNPAFDQYANSNIGSMAGEYRKERKWEHSNVLLWASHKNPSRPAESREIDRLLVDAVSGFDNWKLVIRPHPGEDLIPVVAHPSVYVSIPANEPLAPLLAACNGVITKWSTVGIEGLLLGKPLITLDYLLPGGKATYSSLGLSIGVNGESGVSGAVRGLVNGEFPRPNIAPAGRATDRIVGLIERMVV